MNNGARRVSPYTPCVQQLLCEYRLICFAFLLLFFTHFFYFARFLNSGGLGAVRTVIFLFVLILPPL